MRYLWLVTVLVALICIFQMHGVESASRFARDAPATENPTLKGLEQSFNDGLKALQEQFAKINGDELKKGVENLAKQAEAFGKQIADQFNNKKD